MRSHRRRGPLEHVLIAGDLGELPAIETLLALLPAGAYGQVFVETPTDAELGRLNPPARVTVNRVARPDHGSRGDALVPAVSAWLAEWLPEEPTTERTLTLWVGASVRDRVHAAGAPLERL